MIIKKDIRYKIKSAKCKMQNKKYKIKVVIATVNINKYKVFIY